MDEAARLKRNAYQREYRKANRERTTEIERASKAKRLDHYKASDRARYLAERPERLAAAAARYVPHPAVRTRMPDEQRLAKTREWHYANREARLEQKRAWAQANPHRGASYSAKRRATLLQATPAWAEPFFIEGAYEVAALRSQITGQPWEVDHIVPLISDRVCGLHVHDNLRVIPRLHNRSRGNREWPDQ